MRLFFLQLLLAIPLGSWGQGQLHGIITDKANNEPLEGVEVSLLELERSVFTDQDGAYQLDRLMEGSFTLKVSHPEYIFYEREIKIFGDRSLNFSMIHNKAVTDRVLITAIRATDKTATTYSSLDKEDIAAVNYGQDLPVLLDQLPSVVVNSDAGAGVGYTGIRIRGTDPTRTNVTINGIPLNDAEAHGVFWVNLPDLASSVDQLQVQRGVGTSTNGAAAFGASINIQTNTLNAEPYARLDNSYGSFNTWKNTVRAGTGLLKDKFTFDLRLSNITSDGWVDRAFSDLKSFYFSGGYYGEKSLLKFNILAGKEQTYQSWWGVEASALENEESRRANFYTYENETDNYWQTHYQLFYTYAPSEVLNVNTALHYTPGRGYFEQFREEDSFSSYPSFGFSRLLVNNDTITTTDLVRRRWLDNDFYGFTYSVNYTPTEAIQLTLGGAWNRYDGEHFGEVIWARFAGANEIRDRYYESSARKDDFNSYLKAIYQLNDKLNAYVDLQIRTIDYRYGDESLSRPGTDNDLRPIQGVANYTFFNPKVGLSFQMNSKEQLYASYSVSNREPVRGDFVDAPLGNIPEPERLNNLEAGYRFKSEKARFNANIYWMDYTDQLVLTGALNDVGAAIRQNVEDSYRLGIELEGSLAINHQLGLAANLALSENKIRQFDELLYNYDPFEINTIVHENTDISFSPGVIGGASLRFSPWKHMNIHWVHKYVGRQFLDNTGDSNRSIDPFYVSQLRFSQDVFPSWAKEINLGFQINNLFNANTNPMAIPLAISLVRRYLLLTIIILKQEPISWQA